MTDGVVGGAGVLAIAHRGDPISFRENTVPAIRSAIEAGADIVEIDVKTTSDGVSVVLHDDSLTRLWEVDRDIWTMTAGEVAAVGAGSPVGLGIPTLEQALRLFDGTGTAVLIDMDSAQWVTAARYAVQQVVDAGHLRPSQVIWCGDTDGMREVRATDPTARIFLSWGEEARGGPPGDELVEALRPEAFNPHWTAVEAGGRDWARRKGLALSCWTVDEAADMRRLVEGGVDAMISNRIQALLEVVRGE
ncbi:glycerophosphodiester phosphodiesterase [Lapillicoccus sp.]|uniref:glycerophosphodiester phosphodiesterase n=1 Tax=Lapillicoccus sp. TaxID=1909287 RepID=UPI0039835606